MLLSSSSLLLFKHLLTAAAVAAYTAAQSKNKKASAADAVKPALFTAATALMHNFEEADTRIEEEMARVEDAIDSEDKRKLAALLKPGALPSMEIYMADKLKVRLKIGEIWQHCSLALNHCL